MNLIPITDSFRIAIWIIVGISTIIFTIISGILGPSIAYWVIHRIPGEEKRGIPPTRRIRGWVIWFLYSLSALIMVVGTAFASSAPIAPKFELMAGEYRVAIAGFDVIGDDNNKEFGRQLADGIKLRLDQELAEVNPDLIITIWGPEKVGYIKGRDNESRDNEAELLAKKIDADLVVYGEVDARQSIWLITPKFLITSSNSYEAEDIVGQYDFGSPITLQGQGNIADRVVFGEKMAVRSKVLSRIAVGLSFYAIHNYGKALEILKSTESIKDWDDDEAKKITYLLIGNAAGKSKEINEAKEYYERSLSIDPGYSRAIIGVASVNYDLAIEKFVETSDPNEIKKNYLESAIFYYQKALASSFSPINANISEKAHMGLGQCYIVSFFIGNEINFDPAKDQFVFVINSYGDGKNLSIKELAAEAHARLGFISDLTGDLSTAIIEYQAAVDLLSEYPERRMEYQLRIEKINEKIITLSPVH